MLIKEYRIPLPLTVEEYRIAQLYMIAKKSREESKGAESGVEILVNEPYENGPGGKGQYTHKVFHIGSHLPGWIRGILPLSRLSVEEQAWNAYPYTKTVYSCQFLQRFSVEIETYYYPDGGHQENVFGLSGSDLRRRAVDVIDVVKDQLYGADYVREEDPRFYVSQKTGRGPIGENWIEEYSKECEGRQMPLPNGKAIMTAYKLCKVDLHIWGMQSKLENFIHSVALRKTMLRAHRQAWTWQDEWVGLTMEDIREIERQTQESLKRKMAGYQETDEEENEVNHAREFSTDSFDEPAAGRGAGNTGENRHDYSNTSFNGVATNSRSNAGASSSTIRVSVSDMSDQVDGAVASTSAVFAPNDSEGSLGPHHRHPKSALQGKRSASKSALNSPASSSSKSLELIASWRVETLMTADSGSDTEDEFFDALGEQEADARSLTKWSSLDLIPQETDGEAGAEELREDEDSIFSQHFLQRLTAEREKAQRSLHTRGSVETSLPGSPTMQTGTQSKTQYNSTVLCLVVHAGSALDAALDLPAKKSDVTTFKGAFESVIRQHYPSMMGRVTIKLVPCPAVCTDALAILSSLSPYSFDVYGAGDSPQMTHESVPLGAIPLLATAQAEYWDAVNKTVTAANQVHQEFLRSDEGQGFSGQVILIADSLGSILAYDALTRASHHAHYTTDDEVPPSPGHALDGDYLLPTAGSRRRSSSSVSDPGGAKLDFEVSDFFMLGSPLALVLAQRKILSDDKSSQPIRPCQQVFNLFHPTDPLASRLEPLLSARFAAIAPINVARYSKYPLGDGQPYHLLECVQCNPDAFADSRGANLGTLTPSSTRRLSEISIQSGISGLLDAIPLQTINLLTQKWWGNKRIDYALYCPEALANFPTNSLPHLFHASYWESLDAIAFLIRQLVVPDPSSSAVQEDKDQVQAFTPTQPREKWIKKRTSVKLKNISANHRANDVIVKEGLPQVLKARFMYGPLDVVSLSGEKVDIYLMKDPPAGEWVHLSTEMTDKNGRVIYTIPPEKACSYGIYPVQMFVRGDHTSVEFYLAVVPPCTECVVFSIDGSFTASMSVTGRDPRVRAGAVDVVRHWQELGYLIIYVTGRPDMQQHLVVAWLAQHNFPHGLVSFADGLSTDFLGHKTDYLRNLVQVHELVIHAAYGSCKDISVYSSLGVPSERIFIVGKVPKKQHNLATVLTDGYAVHLNELQAYGGSRPAQGNSRMVIPRGHFGLPGQSLSVQRRKSAKRASSYPASTRRTGIEENPVGAPSDASTRGRGLRTAKSNYAAK